MSNFISVIENFLDNEGLHYTTQNYDWGTDTRISFRGEAGSPIRVHIVDREDQAPYIIVWDLVHIPKDKLAAALIQTNDDNQRRYFRFAYDEDGDLNFGYEFPAGLTEESFAAVLEAMFPLFITGCHLYSEKYNRLIWGNQSSVDEIKFA